MKRVLPTNDHQKSLEKFVEWCQDTNGDVMEMDKFVENKIACDFGKDSIVRLDTARQKVEIRDSESVSEFGTPFAYDEDRIAQETRALVEVEDGGGKLKAKPIIFEDGEPLQIPAYTNFNPNS